MITVIKRFFRQKNRRNRAKTAAARAAVCLLLLASLEGPLTLITSAAVNLYVRDLSIGTLSNKGTHYEINVPAGVSLATFTVSITGADYDSTLMMRTFLVESSSHPIAGVTPEKVQITSGSSIIVTMRLSENFTGAAQTGDIELSFLYEGTNSPLGNVVVRVTRAAGEAGAAAQESAGTSGSVDSVKRVIESTTVMPQIAIDGNTATLTYKNPSLVSWDGPEQDMTLTLSDVSVLEKDTPIQVPGPKTSGVTVDYTVIIPAEQINSILAAKADYIARHVLTGVDYKEDQDENGDDMIVLVPVSAIPEQEYTTITPLDERFNSAVDGSFTLVAGSFDLFDAAEEDLILQIEVSYKSVACMEPAVVNVPLSNSEYFPSLHGFSLDGGITIGGGSSGETGSSIQLTDAVLTGGLMQKYDPEQENYLQWIDGNQQFRSSVPNGMSTNSVVVFDYTPGMEFEVYRNGERVEYLTGQTLTESGRYNVRIYASVDDKEALAGAGDLGEITGLVEALKVSKLFRFDFDIVNGAVSGPCYYNAPVGFYIESVTLSDKPVSLPNEEYAELAEDGEYEIKIAGQDAPGYTVYMTVDSSAPVLKLNGVYNGGITYDTVTLEPGKDTVKMTVLKDSQPYSVNSRNTIDKSGVYTVTVEDLAGNYTKYQFRVMYSMNISGVTAIILSAATALALGGYLYYIRTHMKVR